MTRFIVWLGPYSGTLGVSRNSRSESISHPSKCRRSTLARAFHLYSGYLDFDGALAEVGVARQTLPNDARIFRLSAYIQRRQGRWEESARNVGAGT